MADPVVIECSSACSVTLQVTSPLLDLTAEEGGQLAAAILIVWAVGFGFRMVIQTMREAGSTKVDEG